MQPDSKIYIAGHRGLVGSALVRRLITPSSLAGKGARSSPSPLAGKDSHSSPLSPRGRGPGRGKTHTNIITRAHAELDLTDQQAVRAFFEKESAAAKVGGILANNTYPAEFIHQNLAIQANVSTNLGGPASSGCYSSALPASARATAHSRSRKDIGASVRCRFESLT